MVALLSPITIKGVEIKNRIVMPPMASELGTGEGRVTDVKKVRKQLEQEGIS